MGGAPSESRLLDRFGDRRAVSVELPRQAGALARGRRHADVARRPLERDAGERRLRPPRRWALRLRGDADRRLDPRHRLEARGQLGQRHYDLPRVAPRVLVRQTDHPVPEAPSPPDPLPRLRRRRLRPAVPLPSRRTNMGLRWTTEPRRHLAKDLPGDRTDGPQVDLVLLRVRVRVVRVVIVVEVVRPSLGSAAVPRRRDGRRVRHRVLRRGGLRGGEMAGFAVRERRPGEIRHDATLVRLLRVPLLARERDPRRRHRGPGPSGRPPRRLALPLRVSAGPPLHLGRRQRRELRRLAPAPAKPRGTLRRHPNLRPRRRTERLLPLLGQLLLRTQARPQPPPRQRRRLRTEPDPVAAIHHQKIRRLLLRLRGHRPPGLGRRKHLLLGSN
mmetsp:Transcript_4376/g.14502  ORF Transcript_4376/g.14502 Transcript_4376/m.14502 type:complete len:387 (-) Transcript_4376:111-1271(-)